MGKFAKKNPKQNNNTRTSVSSVGMLRIQTSLSDVFTRFVSDRCTIWNTSTWWRLEFNGNISRRNDSTTLFQGSELQLVAMIRLGVTLCHKQTFSDILTTAVGSYFIYQRIHGWNKQTWEQQQIWTLEEEGREEAAQRAALGLAGQPIRGGVTLSSCLNLQRRAVIGQDAVVTNTEHIPSNMDLWSWPETSWWRDT